MNDIVPLPFWLFSILAIFAALGFVQFVFAPGVRWFLRRRVNRAIDQLNTRLKLSIQPIKLTRRQTLVDQLLYDADVVSAVEAHAEEEGISRAEAMNKAETYAREIVPAFSAYAYFAIGTRIARWLSHFVYRVRLGYADEDKIAAVGKDATVVFVMNHRSNMDYVLVTYLASTSASLSYAVGEWARVFLLENLIRSMGAYFIRRNSRNALYRKVLSRYVRMATRFGVTQAVFPEGGLTRDGLLRPPKLGLLSYMVSDFNPDTDKDIVFVPVGLNYDRVIEDRILTGPAQAEIDGRAFRVSISKSLAFIGRMIARRVRGKLYRYGYACVSFGSPISLKEWLSKNKQDKEKIVESDINDLGVELMAQIGVAIPVLPVSLIASILLEGVSVDTITPDDDGLDELQLKAKTSALIAELEAAGAHVHIPRQDLDYAITAGLRILILRQLITQEDGRYRANPDETLLLRYYANSIGHLRQN